MLTKTTSQELQTFFDAYATSDITHSHRILNTPSDYAKEHLFYIQEAGYLKSLKSHISQREQLNSYLFLIVLSGHGKFTYKDKRHQISSGDCLFINCNNPYSHQSSEEDPWELMWVHFNGKSILPYITHYENTYPDSVLHTNRLTEYTTLIETCLELMKQKDLTSEFMLSKLLTDLLTLPLTQNEVASLSHSTEKMHQIKTYIDQYYQKKLSLGEIAESFYISKHYLAREFKKFFGMTIGDYICSRRITYSKELLRFTYKTIEEISSSCGIPDTNYFAKVFRKLEECSPSEYRKKWCR
jgi:AraC-like DNA-binding protein/mannose-6-phosphate isomerase-like protein (cupin superfamily)